tara:strand:- start:980 stop:4375 length:3396 start_codon:yes stop_codon:yes gene_type:complete
MALRNQQVVGEQGRDTDNFSKVLEGADKIIAKRNAAMDKELRQIVGSEYDKYTDSQKAMARQALQEKLRFFHRGNVGLAKPGVTDMYGDEYPNPYEGMRFNDEALGDMIRDAAPLYETPGTMTEGVVSRDQQRKVDEQLRQEDISPRDGLPLDEMYRPSDDQSFPGFAERNEGFYKRERDKIEETLPSEVDDFSGYAQGMERMERLDPESPQFRQGLAEGGEVEDPAAKSFFTGQVAYTPEQYGSGYIDFYGGALGSTGIDVETVEEDEEEEEEETVLSQAINQGGEDSILYGTAPTPTTYRLGSGRGATFSVQSYKYQGAEQSDFGINFTDMGSKVYADKNDSFVKNYLKDKGMGIQANPQAEAALAPISAALGATLATAGGTLFGEQVAAPFGKDTTYRPTGLAGFGLDLALSFHTKNAAAVDLAGGRAGSLMTVNNMLVSRKPGDYRYTGNLMGMTNDQMLGIEATKEGFIAGTMKDEYDEVNKTWTKIGMKGLLDSDTAFKFGMNISETGHFIDIYGRGAGKVRGQGGTEVFAAAYDAARAKYGITEQQFRDALSMAQEQAGFFGTVRGKHRNATFLSDALRGFQKSNAEAAEARKKEEAARREEEARKALETEGRSDPGISETQAYKDRIAEMQRQYEREQRQGDSQREREERQRERSREQIDRSNRDSGGRTRDPYSGSAGGGGRAMGGRVGLREGGTPGEGIPPAGFVEGPPGQFSDSEKVADDKDMAVEKDSFVINAAAVEMAGVDDIRKMLLDAYSTARKQGAFDVDRPLYEKAVDVSVSKGEVVVPPQLARIIGYDRLRKINNRGKPKTEERVEESGQSPQGAFLGGFLGFGNDDNDVEVMTPPTAEERRASKRTSTPGPIQEAGRELPEEGFVSRSSVATPSTPLPERTDFENLTTSLLQRLEDNRFEGYVPTNNSGVTIGRGFDIGQHDSDDLERMSVDTGLIARLTPYLKKTGQAARDALAYEASQGRPLKFTKEEEGLLEDLNLTVQRAKYRDFERVMGNLGYKMPEDPVDRAAVFAEFYVGNFRTKDEGSKLTIRKSFMDEVERSGNAFHAFQVGVLDRLKTDSPAARRARNRSEKTMEWIMENRPDVDMFQPTLPKPEKPYSYRGKLPKSSPVRN